MTENNQILDKIDLLIKGGEQVSEYKIKNSLYSDQEIAPIPFFSWAADSFQFMLDNFGENNVYIRMFNDKVVADAETTFPQQYHAQFGISILKRLKQYSIENPDATISKKSEKFDELRKIYNNFQKVSVLLANRKHHRTPYLIENEYDVQDLMHACLVIAFDDVRKEIWTPEYCGSSNKVDFLLRGEKIIIETKITSEKHQAKEIGDEFLIDIGHYREIEYCNILSCFVYDPNFYIDNPSGFCSDIEKNSTEKMKIFVDIVPIR